MYESDCRGCRISQGLQAVRGNIIIELDGDWVLNHYGGDEGFLGWLALQPKFHRMDFPDLTPKELASLGGNIARIAKALRHCWPDRFADLIERVYVVYFFESAYDDPPTDFHMHIHMIPRSRKMGEGKSGSETPSAVAAWKTSCLASQPWFPDAYRTRNGAREEEVRELMDCLNLHLASQQRSSHRQCQ